MNKVPRSISHLKVGQRVRVGYRSWIPDEDDVFVGFSGEGEDRRATFRNEDGSTWDAYRFNNRWCVGSSADGAKLYAPIKED